MKQKRDSSIALTNDTRKRDIAARVANVLKLCRNGLTPQNLGVRRLYPHEVEFENHCSADAKLVGIQPAIIFESMQ
jgi:hypothetical protein